MIIHIRRMAAAVAVAMTALAVSGVPRLAYATGYYAGTFTVCATTSAPDLPSCVTSTANAAGTGRTSTVTVAGVTEPSSFSLVPLRSPGGAYTVVDSAAGLIPSTPYRINLLDPLAYEQAASAGLTGAPLSNLTPTAGSKAGSGSVPFLDQKCLEATLGTRGFALATGTTTGSGKLLATTVDLSGAMGSGPAIICVAELDSLGHTIGGNTAPLTIQQLS